MRSRAASWLLLIAVLAVFAIFLVWPVVVILRVGFFGIPTAGQPGGFTLEYIKAIFLDHDLRRGLINSAMIAIAVTLLCTIISVPLALLSVKYDFPGKGAATAMLLVPLILPPFV